MHELPPELLERVRGYSHYQQVDYERLAVRFGSKFLATRLRRQMIVYDKVERVERSPVLRWKKNLSRTAILSGLWCLGGLARARAAAREPWILEREIFFPNLPRGFDGYRVLHLSDFHFDLTPELAGIVRERLAGARFDLCVLTGDYRGETHGAYEESLAHLESAREALGNSVYAILGNHDCIEIMLRLPEMNIHGLVNDAVWLERQGERILLAGIDDPHFYRTHDFSRFRDRIHESPFTLLLAHSPEVYREAAREGVDFMLSGHTHGGQLCLPGGLALVAHVRNTPRALLRGAWKWKNLRGYTSPGVGTSTLDCRLNCPAEITIHVLRRAET